MYTMTGMFEKKGKKKKRQSVTNVCQGKLLNHLS